MESVKEKYLDAIKNHKAETIDEHANVIEENNDHKYDTQLSRKLYATMFVR